VIGGKMNIDFHVHGLLSKKNNFDEKFFLQGVENAKQNGLNAFVLCEHFNAKDIESIYEYLKENYKYIGDSYIVNDFYVFVGVEVDVKNGGHVIVSGNRDNLEKVIKSLENYKVKPNFIEFEELLNIAEENKCLIIGSHPFRENNKLYLQPEELLSRMDALDLNATDIHSRGLKNVEEEVADLAKKLKIQYVTGSDSHCPVQLGAVFTSLGKECSTIEDIKKCIREKDFKVNISKALELKVFSARITKKYFKEKNTTEMVL
jgi:histidinol phosphatase-like PHP family hydrolase